MLEEVLPSERLQALVSAIQKKSCLVEHLSSSGKAFLLAALAKASGKSLLIISDGADAENGLLQDLENVSSQVHHFPAWEVLPQEDIEPSKDVIGQRFLALHALINGPQILIATTQSLLQRLLPQKLFTSSILDLQRGQDFTLEGLIGTLKVFGYQQELLCGNKGEFAIRQSLIDVYPLWSKQPFRLVFAKDKLVSIKPFDAASQLSVGDEVESLAICLAGEAALLKKAKTTESLLDYLGDCHIIFDEPATMEDHHVKSKELLARAGTKYFDSFADVFKRCQKAKLLYLSEQAVQELSDVEVLKNKAERYYSYTAKAHAVSFSFFGMDLKAERWPPCFVPLTDLEGAPNVERILFVAAHFAPFEDTLTKWGKPVTKQVGYLNEGFIVPDCKLAVIPSTVLTHKHRIRRPKQHLTSGSFASDMLDLEPGQTVVHMQNGVGKYTGTQLLKNAKGEETEFLVLEYANNGKLFVPPTQVHQLSKYMGIKEVDPKLHTLGTSNWARLKTKTEIAIDIYAQDLLRMHAERSMSQHTRYGPDTSAMKAFEEDFPYEPTADQTAAIAAFKADLASENGMDRLLCGDVGYGKTEVAMRAAFKVVCEGKKQVAVLVPTTLLAVQHYETFKERMATFGVRVACLSRLQTPKETRDILKLLAAHEIDILVGTHRIVSKDVRFTALGLIIIDEEQRFGVKVKEDLKAMKAGVPTLTLSATPIPRTLYMSMMGAKDLSTINTPPQDRLPIQTVVCEYNIDMIKTAILRELARDGQVFYIHNRVETIFDVANRLKELLPQARILVGHGQMDAGELEVIFAGFKAHRADILISTTIVEAGIDIPNANTLIVERADRFGAAELYQLRGRVGRGSRRAYAYLLTAPRAPINEVTQKRLMAILESSGFGGGMKLAMRDLEIRGAGDILGTEQSGHVAAVGFHLYCKLLKRKVLELQGKIPRATVDCRLEFPQDARIPVDFMPDINLRLSIYQRLGEAATLEEVEELWKNVLDRFGQMPQPAQMLYHLSRIRIQATRALVSCLKLIQNVLVIEQRRGSKVDTRRVPLAAPKNPAELEAKVLKALSSPT